jgi:hypothetical protein
MGWAVGFDPQWGRDIGYGVPARDRNYHKELETVLSRTGTVSLKTQRFQNSHSYDLQIREKLPTCR